MAKIEDLLEYGCEFGCAQGECGHTHCEVCRHTSHSCAGCGNDYCECSEASWVEGANGITYCSQECAAKYGEEN